MNKSYVESTLLCSCLLVLCKLIPAGLRGSGPLSLEGVGDEGYFNCNSNVY